MQKIIPINFVLISLCVVQTILPITITNRSGYKVKVTLFEHVSKKQYPSETAEDAATLFDGQSVKLAVLNGTFEIDVQSPKRFLMRGKYAWGEFTAPEDKSIEIVTEDGNLVVRSEHDMPRRAKMPKVTKKSAKSARSVRVNRP